MLTSLVSPAAVFAVLGVFAVAALGALAFRHDDRAANYWGNGFAIVGSSLSLVLSGAILATGTALAFRVPTTFPGLSLSFRIDALSAFFMLIVSLVALVCSVYALDYVRHYYGKYDLGGLGFFYNVFIAAMLLVVTADNALFFLIVWEIMSLASYFLVIFEHRDHANVEAGALYFIMTHVGTAFLILMFLFLHQAGGSFEFAAMKASAGVLSPLVATIVFVSAVIGFGTKAGIIPLHVWLPSAHPAAPSHVSALMSGVMIKTAIYMFVRMFFDILPGSPLWWGLTFLAIGAVTSLLGVLYALAEQDLKKLLAYSSIENVGIILLGLGSALAFSSLGMPVPALLGLLAALYHTLNHAVFKALLFLGAGSVIGQTHTRNFEKYGGLIKPMPQTALFFLIGSMAISALPPLNGFFSEWLTYQALFSGIASLAAAPKVIFILAAGSLAFTGGLAAACFVKAFGAAFLARPRSRHASAATESALTLRLSMAALAVLTCVLGFLASGLTRALAGVAGSTARLAGTPLDAFAVFPSLRVQAGFSSVSMPVVWASLVLVIAAVAVATRLLTRDRRVRSGITWDCGSQLTPRMEITATAFADSIVVVFKNVLKPTRQTEVEYHDAHLRYVPKASTVHVAFADVYQTSLYGPIRSLLARLADRARSLQSGNMNAYLLYISIALIGLLFVLTR